MIDDLIIFWTEVKDYNKLYNCLSNPNTYESLRIDRLFDILEKTPKSLRRKLARQIVLNAPIWFIEENLMFFDACLLLERYSELPQSIKLDLLYDVRKEVAEKLIKLEAPEVLVESTNPYIIKWLSENTDLNHPKIKIYKYFKKFTGKDDIIYIHYFFDDFYYVSLIGKHYQREYLFNTTNKKHILFDITKVDSQLDILKVINSWARGSLTNEFSFFLYASDNIFKKLLRFDKSYALKYVREFLPSRIINHDLFVLSIETILNDRELSYTLFKDYKLREIVWDYIFMNKTLSQKIKYFKYSDLFFESEFVKYDLKKYVKMKYNELFSNCSPEDFLSVLRKLYFLSKTVLVVKLPNNSKEFKLVHYLNEANIGNNVQLLKYVYEYATENDPMLLDVLNNYFINPQQNQ